MSSAKATSTKTAPTGDNIAPAALVAKGSSAIARHDLASARGYRRADLFAVAEVGYHYLMNGGTELARSLFEGLAAVAPREPYFALALGLCHDHLNDREAALQWYVRAGELDARDPRPEINRAEILIEAGNIPAALELLARAHQKAVVSRQRLLERKAAALLDHLRATSTALEGAR